ncbi:hypothetical protein [Roseococcus sp. YIM B11640]|uniref:hypothetical protein n=1 Tax=Roseococcus sp. YIM B11640 TaxID=3133973 RepID=UPI003C7A0335
MIRFSLPALLVAAACASPVPVVPAPVMTNAECAREARTSREVRQTFREENAENQSNMRRVQSERNVALRSEYDDCLRSHGLPVSGGVEPVRRLD